MALMMENIIRVYGLLYGGLTGDTVEEEQEIIDMVERNFEDDLEDADQDNISSPLAQAQEQVSFSSSMWHASMQSIKTALLFTQHLSVRISILSHCITYTCTCTCTVYCIKRRDKVSTKE